ncbi:DUF5106 domain-containing protein [Sphingobacterium spiritivorum]|uniref:DUF5106 domain-containing protein n=1 Tax=Sphingobacterium spiritivorum TaxID=258 RepID=UPI003DA612C9
MKNIASILLFYIGFIACQSPDRTANNLHDNNLDSIAASINGQEHKHYLAEHFWDDIPLADSIPTVRLQYFQQSLVDYLYILNTLQTTIAKKMLKEFLQKKITSTVLLLQTSDFFENHLYNPLSPLRNDELYAIFLEYKLTFPDIEDIYLVRTRYQLNIISKNKVDHIAENFTYTTPKLQKQSLFDVKSKYTLLYFYNPDCPYCEDTTVKMSRSRILQKLTSTRQELRILAICTESTQKKWSDHIVSLPKNWINGYNNKISTQQLYDLRALPSLYLLDREKKVILKDATFQQIETILSEI